MGISGYLCLPRRRRPLICSSSKQIPRLSSAEQSPDRKLDAARARLEGRQGSAGRRTTIPASGCDFRSLSFFHSEQPHRSGGRFVKPAPAKARPGGTVRLDGFPAAP